MNSNFDEATKATEEMFDEQFAEEPAEKTTEEPIEEVKEAVPENESDEVPAEGNAPEDAQGQVMADAVNTAEAAAQAAAEQNQMVVQLQQQLEAEKQKSAQLQGTIDDLSKKNEEELLEEVLSPPVLDISGLAFADEATQQKALADYAAGMAKYNRDQIMKEISPFVEQAKEVKRIKEQNDIVNALSTIPELKNLKEMMPQIERIIKNTPALSSDSVPIDEKIITAFAIAQGVNSMNTPAAEPKELTTEELFEKYKNDPALQEMIEKQRIDQLKGSQQVPPFSASSGAVNAALNIKEKPKTFDEASRRTREMFGLE